MNDVTLVHIVPRDCLVLLELYRGLLIPLLIVINPGIRFSDPGMPARGCNHLRRGNLNVDASPRQLHQACRELGLKHTAEGGVSFFRDVTMQNLKPVVIQVRSHTVWARRLPSNHLSGWTSTKLLWSRVGSSAQGMSWICHP